MTTCNGTMEAYVSTLQISAGLQGNAVSMHPGNRRKYQLPDSFWDRLDGFPVANVGLAQMPAGGPDLPILVDVDLKRDRAVDEPIRPLYDGVELRRMVVGSHAVLREIFAVPEDMLLCVVLTKAPAASSPTVTKHGFHLHYPRVFTQAAWLKRYFAPALRAQWTDDRALASYGAPVFDASTVDEQIYGRKPWLLYGSSKNPTLEPYRVAAVLNAQGDEVDPEVAFRDLVPGPWSPAGAEAHWPRILSIWAAGRPVMIATELHGAAAEAEADYQERASRGKRGRGPEGPTGPTGPTGSPGSPGSPRSPGSQGSRQHQAQTARKDEEQVCYRLLPLIGDARAASYGDWMRIGWALHLISGGSEEGWEAWDTFSQRCPAKYSAVEVRQRWDRIPQDGPDAMGGRRRVGPGSLWYYAREDNPDAVRAFQAEEVGAMLSVAIKGSHYDIAKMLHRYYGDYFSCSNISKKEWYRFDKTRHIWHSDDDGTTLREEISTVFTDVLEHNRTVLMAAREAGDEDEAAGHDRELKQLARFAASLKHSNFKNSVMRECAEVFYDEDFGSRLNTDPMMIAFTNGVYDLRTHTLRPGADEDYITRGLPIPFRDDLDDEHPLVKSAVEFLTQVFPDDDLRAFFVQEAASFFEGGNKNKCATFWTGVGDNGKSIMSRMFEKVFGPLQIKLPTTTISGKKPGMGGAWADMARAGGGVRLAVIEEPNKDEHINVGMLKHLTGCDTIMARELFQKGSDTREIDLWFKLILICIDLPTIRDGDQAMWNRLRVIRFKSRFIRPDAEIPAPADWVDQKRERRFPMDVDFGSRVATIAPAFAWYLLQRRKNPLVLPPPFEVIEANAAYRQTNDLTSIFVKECTKAGDADSRINVTDIHKRYQVWHKDNYGACTQRRQDLQNELTKLWDHPTADPETGLVYWTGRDLIAEVLA